LSSRKKLEERGLIIDYEQLLSKYENECLE
jgi:hypothetical protein